MDNFENFPTSLDSPAKGILEVTPSDGTDLTISSRALAVAEEGTVKVTMVNGTVGTITIVPGAPFAVRATRVWATGTSATGIVALY